MKAAQFFEYGASDVIKVVEVEKPEPKDTQVLVKVTASSVNPFDSKLSQGLMKDSIPLQLPVTIGGDFSGVIVEMGENVEGFEVGDKVFGQAAVVAGNSGAMAEFAVTKMNQVAKAPSTIDLIDAAALPLVGVSAVQALMEHASLQSNQKILIHGGSGGIGTLAIEIAKHLGAYVATTASGEGIDLVKRLGADEVIDYANENFVDKIQDYDVVYDTVGGQVFEDSYKVLKSGGILVSMVGQADEAKAKELEITVISQFTKVTTKRLEMLASLVDSGVVSAQIGQRFTIDQAAEAFAAKEAGQILGKILVTVSE